MNTVMLKGRGPKYKRRPTLIYAEGLGTPDSEYPPELRQNLNLISPVRRP